jgi:hypothetical protein
MGLLDILDAAMKAKGPAQRRRPENYSSLIPQEDAGGLLSRAATMTAPVPVLGDVMGLLNDAQMYRTKPEERTPGNFALTALGALPFVPAMAGTFAGVGAKTADVAALGKAQEMTKAGVDPVEVWKATGWTDQFPDKKWRFEISDDAAKVRANPKDFGTPRLVAESVDHSQYFSAYPELKDMTAEFTRRLPGERGSGSFGLLEDYPHIKVNENKSGRKSTTMHEMQHAVQGEEGFARGGSPTMGLGMSLPEGWRKPEAQAAVLAQHIKQWEKSYPKVLASAIADSPPELVPIAKELAKSKSMDELRTLAGSADYEAYRRLAGEAEARLTQSRIPLTAAERRARPPWVEFDVPPEQQIVRGLLD